jgi:hypothetical protein
MGTVRRWYIFLVCAVTLQSITWAAISLLRNLLTVGRETPVTTIALQVAIVAIGLPLFLVHWLWAQRLARQSPHERQDGLRRLYLYGTLAGLLAPFVTNTFYLVWEFLWLAFGGSTEGYSLSDALVYDLGAMVVLGLLWTYHWRVARADTAETPESGKSATARRLYTLGFSAAGLTMTTLAVIRLLRWLMFQTATGEVITAADPSGLAQETARLIVGLSLWLVFWQRAQKLFTRGSEEERESALRKLYIYLAVLIGSLGAITNAAAILAGLFRRLLDLPSRGDIRIPLPSILGMCAIWAFHAYVLRGDASVAREVPRQVAIRRLYLYLVAGVGLAAFLVGVGGCISVLVRSIAAQSLGDALKEQLAWFAAALLAGLPVWVVPWRAVQISAVAPTPAGIQERRSLVRKIYLYFFLFIATMTVLSGAVYIVWQLLTVALGERVAVGLSSALGQAVAFSLIGVGVWLYHGSAVRGDSRLAKREQVDRMASLRLAILDVGDGRFGRAVIEALQRDWPGMPIDAIGLTETATHAMQKEGAVGDEKGTIASRLARAGLIVGPWDIVLSGGAQGSITPQIAQTVVRSPAVKILAPMPSESFEWAGVERLDAEAFARHAVHAVRQFAEGAEIRPSRPLSAGAVIGIIFGVLLLLILVAIPLLSFFNVF